MRSVAAARTAGGAMVGGAVRPGVSVCAPPRGWGGPAEGLLVPSLRNASGTLLRETGPEAPWAPPRKAGGRCPCPRRPL